MTSDLGVVRPAAPPSLAAPFASATAAMLRKKSARPPAHQQGRVRPERTREDRAGLDRVMVSQTAALTWRHQFGFAPGHVPVDDVRPDTQPLPVSEACATRYSRVSLSLFHIYIYILISSVPPMAVQNTGKGTRGTPPNLSVYSTEGVS